MRVVCIVEGHGELAAVPVLLRRVALWLSPTESVDVSPPIRVKRNRFIGDENEFRKYVELASMKCDNDGLVLILLDADDDCPANLGVRLMERARQVAPHRRVSVVLANREFEAWFIGAAASLNGFRGLVVCETDLNVDPEQPRDAKGWIGSRMRCRNYGVTTDQPAFAARMDLEAARLRCRSFRKLCSDWNDWITQAHPR